MENDLEFVGEYVHYKWKPTNEQTKKDIETVLEKVEATVEYVKELESKYVYMSQKERIQTIFQRRAEQVAGGDGE